MGEGWIIERDLWAPNKKGRVLNERTRPLTYSGLIGSMTSGSEEDSESPLTNLGGGGRAGGAESKTGFCFASAAFFANHSFF